MLIFHYYHVLDSTHISIYRISEKALAGTIRKRHMLRSRGTDFLVGSSLLIEELCTSLKNYFETTRAVQQTPAWPGN